MYFYCLRSMSCYTEQNRFQYLLFSIFADVLAKLSCRRWSIQERIARVTFYYVFKFYLSKNKLVYAVILKLLYAIPFSIVCNKLLLRLLLFHCRCCNYYYNFFFWVPDRGQERHMLITLFENKNLYDRNQQWLTTTKPNCCMGAYTHTFRADRKIKTTQSLHNRLIDVVTFLWPGFAVLVKVCIYLR